MNKFEIMVTLGMIVLAIIGGYLIAQASLTCDNPVPISPQNDIGVEKVDMAYNIETNLTYWKFPNETEWHLLE